jgi:hypothetical protein
LIYARMNNAILFLGLCWLVFSVFRAEDMGT